MGIDSLKNSSRNPEELAISSLRIPSLVVSYPELRGANVWNERILEGLATASDTGPVIRGSEE